MKEFIFISTLYNPTNLLTFKKRLMKKVSLFTVLFLTTVFFTYGQDCKVKSEAIAGKYEGNCKKKLADGQGKSVGTDTYEGTFKKGLPHGKGVYTYSNGDVFDGNFAKGRMHGEGKLTQADGEEKIGFWEHNEYIGKFAKKFEVLNQGSKISRIAFNYKNGDSNQIDIVSTRDGKIINRDDINVVNIDGFFGNINQTPRMKSILSVQYPLRFTVSGAHEFEAVINTPGHWEVTVSY